MTERPSVKPRDWIDVGNTRCVVSRVREPNHQFGDCEVVFDGKKPANRDVRWTGNNWEFIETGDFGGYAEKYPRLREFVQILKRGE